MSGTIAALSDTTTNDLNRFNVGSVDINDNDTNSALYQVDDAYPGYTQDSCITLTYNGTVPNTDVKLYMPTALNTTAGTTSAPFTDLLIESGTVPGGNAFDDCTGFTPEAAPTVFNGTLASFQTTHNSYANGKMDYPAATTGWQPNDKVTYRFRTTLQAGVTTGGLTSGVHTYTWETQNK